MHYNTNRFGLSWCSIFATDCCFKHGSKTDHTKSEEDVRSHSCGKPMVKGWQSQKGCSWIYCKFGARMPNMFKPSNTKRRREVCVRIRGLHSFAWLAQGTALYRLQARVLHLRTWSRTPPLQKGEMPCRYHDDSNFAFQQNERPEIAKCRSIMAGQPTSPNISHPEIRADYGGVSVEHLYSRHSFLSWSFPSMSEMLKRLFWEAVSLSKYHLDLSENRVP